MLLHSKLMVEMVEVLMHSKGLISPYSPLNPINSLEWEPRLDVDCCGHAIGNLSMMFDPEFVTKSILDR